MGLAPIHLVKSTLIFSILFLLPGKSWGQFNFLVNYDFSVVQMNELSDVYTQFNDDNTWFDIQKTHVNIMNGVEGGAQYWIDGVVGIYATGGWSVWRHSAKGLNPSTNGTEKVSLQLSRSRYAVGLVGRIDRVGIGGQFNFDRYTSRLKIKDTEERDNMRNQTIDLHLSYFLPADQISLAIRPYVSIPINNLDYAPVVQRLTPDNYDSNSTYDMRPFTFGFRLIIMNGPQVF